MFVIIAIIIGGFVGWLACLIMRTDNQAGIVLNLIVGIIGALLGLGLLSPLFGVSMLEVGRVQLSGIIASVLGGVTLISLVNLIRRAA